MNLEYEYPYMYEYMYKIFHAIQLEHGQTNTGIYLESGCSHDGRPLTIFSTFGVPKKMEVFSGHMDHHRLQ